MKTRRGIREKESEKQVASKQGRMSGRKNERERMRDENEQEKKKEREGKVKILLAKKQE